MTDLTLPDEQPVTSRGIRRGQQQTPQALVLQTIMIAGLFVVVALLASNAMQSLARQGIASGFAFLDMPAPFRLSESILDMGTGATYTRAYLAGLANTLAVAVLGVTLATILGFLVGFARLSSNGLLSGLASVYVEWMRNVPLILHLSLWYVVVTTGLPTLRNAFQPFDGVFLSNRGLQLPKPLFGNEHGWMLAGLIAGCLLAVTWVWKARKAHAITGRRRAVFLPSLALIAGPTVLALLLSGETIAFEAPVRSGLAIRGGATLSPEFVVLVLGLSIYTSGFIAEIVRAGVLSVSQGQSEAGRALGLHRTGIMWLVVMPQAMRVMLPPLTTQFTNLIKNSSLAVIIGYPDLVSVTNTSLNQTGQAIECIAIMMALYMLVSLVVSGVMGFIEHQTRIVTR